MARPTIDEVLKVLQSLMTEAPLEDDPWDEKTVDIRVNPEKGEADRMSQQQEPKDALANSTLMRSYETRKWRQILISGQNGFWVVEMGENGPTVQSLKVSREGRPYPLNNAKELEEFEQRFHLDREPWPGNIVMTKSRII